MLGERVQQLADELGVGITILAEHMGFERSTPSNWRSRASKGKDPDYKSLIRVAECMQVSTDWLIGRPHADKWSPRIRRAQEALHQLALSSPGLSESSVTGRVRWVWDEFSKLVPEMSRETWLLYLGWAPADWTKCVSGKLLPGSVQLDALVELTALPEMWYRDGNRRCLEEISPASMQRLSRLMAAENLDPEDVLRLVRKALARENE